MDLCWQNNVSAFLLRNLYAGQEATVRTGHEKTNIIASGPITAWQIEGEKVGELFSWDLKSMEMVTAAMKLKVACSLEGKL